MALRDAIKFLLTLWGTLRLSPLREGVLCIPCGRFPVLQAAWQVAVSFSGLDASRVPWIWFCLIGTSVVTPSDCQVEVSQDRCYKYQQLEGSFPVGSIKRQRDSMAVTEPLLCDGDTPLPVWVQAAPGRRQSSFSSQMTSCKLWTSLSRIRLSLGLVFLLTCGPTSFFLLLSV